jgi:enoyl-CoA hydratase/carnithine racemase
LTKPRIAVVNGPAVGGGFELVLGCEFAVASTSAFFALPEVAHGLMPGAGGLPILARNLPLKKAAEVGLLGVRLSASDALRWGLISRVVEPQELASSAEDLAQTLAQADPFAVRAVRAVLRRENALAGPDGPAWTCNQRWSRTLRRRRSGIAMEGL